MSFIERKVKIISVVENMGGVCNINSLSKKLFISKSTLRRDLIVLENEGIIQRYHGGIRLVSDSAIESSLSMRRTENRDKKIIIAKTAGKFLNDNMVIFLDSSSTVSYLVPILRTFKNLTVITNGINIATQLNTAPDIKCYICPGLLRHQSLSIIGEYSSDFLKNFHADIVFLSSKALRPDGIYEGDDNQALCKRMMIKNSDKKILLCDSTKEYSIGYFKLTDYSDIDIVVSNSVFSHKINDVLLTSGCNLIVPE